MRFILCTEDDDNKGETWCLWIQLKGNRRALYDFEEFLSNQKGKLPRRYTLNLEYPHNEAQVDHLLETVVSSPSSKISYVYAKVTGTFICPTVQDLKDPERTLYEVLRQSGLLDFSTAPTRGSDRG